MPRPTRSFIDHGCYHIITRGNQKQLVFYKEKDYKFYLSIVKKAKVKYNINLYAYCLMPNHIHLLIESAFARNISSFMHYINRGYTAYFNCDYNKCGHLWQGRYKSRIIIKGQYLIHCSNYIEANPVRAKIAIDIADYPYSSYRERCYLSKNKFLDEFCIENTALRGQL